VRPLEGITLVVDLDEMKIVEYYDRFIVLVPKAEGTDYRASKQKPPFGPRLNGAALVQLDGPGFKIDGHTVRSVFSSSFFCFNVWTKQIYPLSFLFRVIFTLARFEIALINLRVALSGS
jgi:hypothetical protein